MAFSCPSAPRLRLYPHNMYHPCIRIFVLLSSYISRTNGMGKLPSFTWVTIVVVYIDTHKTSLLGAYRAEIENHLPKSDQQPDTGRPTACLFQCRPVQISRADETPSSANCILNSGWSRLVLSGPITRIEPWYMCALDMRLETNPGSRSPIPWGSTFNVQVQEPLRCRIRV